MSRQRPSDDPNVADRIASIGEVLSDPRRVRVLFLLSKTPATVSEISTELGLRPAETSVQLARLRSIRVVRVLRRGRHRIYSADVDALSSLLGVLSDVATRDSRLEAAGRIPPSRPAPDSPLRAARSCYDHLAGVLGVELASRMVAETWLVPSASDFLLTRRGEEQLLRRGVDVVACRETRRKLAPACLDWTERKPHVGGALGAAILRTLEEHEFVSRTADRRVRVLLPIDSWFRAPRSSARASSGTATSQKLAAH